MLRFIANYIRNRLRGWLGVSDAQPIDTEEGRRKGISIAQQVLIKAGEKTIVRRPFKAPDLLPGVVPTTLPTDDPGGLGAYLAADSELIAPAYSYANQFNCGLGFPGYAYLAELSQRSEYRAPSETIASEMTREWVKLVTKGKGKKKGYKANTKTWDEPRKPRPSETGDDAKPADADGDGDIDGGLEDKIEQLTEALETFKVREMFRKAAELDGLFGRAQIYIDIDPGNKSEDEVQQLPLLVEPETIAKGSVRGFKVVEPIWTTPYNYNASNPLAPDFYKPRAWFVLGKRVHASRLLMFISREVPDILKPAYNFGGLSMTQLMEADVFQWLRTRNSVSDLIHNFSVMCLATDMSNILSGEPDKPGGLADRAKLFTQYRDNQGLTVLNKDTEELVAVNVPLSTLDKLQAQAQEHQAAPSHIPLVKLLGITPTGLNASSEGEIKVFYDFVRACQQNIYNDPFNIILQVLQLHLFGSIDDAIGFEWVPLSSPTVKELSEIRKADAETDAILIDKGVIAPEESRERVATDPNSGYTNLSGDAPEPPDLTGMEKQHQLGEEAASNAHERSLEAQAEAAKHDKAKAA